jgi:REP element-mobilizing transposase RayT
MVALQGQNGLARRSATKRGAQRDLPFRTWGGLRAGAGRKPVGPRAGVPHVVRPDHRARHPVHVTLHAVQRFPSLRRQIVFIELRRALARSSSKRFSVVHFSVQPDHVHLLVEAADKLTLSRGASGLAIRLARAANAVLRRRGRVWGDRYHARALSSPREVRHALVYVLTNWRKHIPAARGLDPCASARWFDGWRNDEGSLCARPARTTDEPPVAPARTWLGAVGWRRHGLIDIRERPKVSTRISRS